MIIASFFDDLIVTGNSLDLLSKVKGAFKENYTMSDLGALGYRLRNVHIVYE